MEIVFLLVLIGSMVVALGAGFPVAFALPGSAILTIALAGGAGELFAGDMGAYFAQGDPIQWLNAGVTNFRGIYWEAERDTLIAIPLFIFMGIMLERSKIAEDLLVAMAQLFGTIPGGLGISVVVVGALLAATTGIVGATVIAMGLISLPVMLRANYSHALATGTISASGTLGQIIPPSIVLIILADQLANATDQASAVRTAEYKEATGSFALPTEFDLTSTSAGDMFMGALLPGLVLVGIYITFILIVALVRPNLAPPAPHDGKMDAGFFARVALVLVPPLALIVCVLGSIVAGIATVNQAGAIGAVGALIMAGYRLHHGAAHAFRPAILALVGLIGLGAVLTLFDVNVRTLHTTRDWVGLWLAAFSSAALTAAVIWSAVRAYRTDGTLGGVMIETAKTTSLVFIILLGAAMLTAAFRAFGGEELVKEFLTHIPGGFYAKFVVVMLVIFILGFFLDFIEIAVVVVPIIAPILLADPEANVTAVWLGVMIGLNMQTSFLTPPFGFALFYLRGVAPPVVKTLSMYKGVVPFIGLQLLALVIVGLAPPLVNYLPTQVSLTSETAPPPKNPRLQACMEPLLFDRLDADRAAVEGALGDLAAADLSALPKKTARALQKDVIDGVAAVFPMIPEARSASAAAAAQADVLRPLHREVRALRVRLEGDEAAVEAAAPTGWAEERKLYGDLAKADTVIRRKIARALDDAWDAAAELRAEIAAADALVAVQGDIAALADIVADDGAADRIRDVARSLNDIAGSNDIRKGLSSARRDVRGADPEPVKALEDIEEALRTLKTEVAWRTEARTAVLPALERFIAAADATVGLRAKDRLPADMAGDVAACMSHHRDISLHF
jgi:tripartite ATP-independent transporter DctM subunit